MPGIPPPAPALFHGATQPPATLPYQRQRTLFERHFAILIVISTDISVFSRN
jgi:hypothetical protein